MPGGGFSRAAAAALVVLVLAALQTLPQGPAAQQGGGQLSGAANTRYFFVFGDPATGRVLATFPSSLSIEYRYTWSEVLSQEYSGSRYQLTAAQWYWANPPAAQVADVPELGSRVILYTEVSFDPGVGGSLYTWTTSSVSTYYYNGSPTPYTEYYTYTNSYAVLSVVVVVRLTIAFDRVPAEVGEVDIGSLVERYFFSGSPPSIYYYVSASNGWDTRWHSETVSFPLSGYKVAIYTASVWLDSLAVDHYESRLEGGVLHVYPVHRARACGVVRGLDTSMPALVSVHNSSAYLELSQSGGCADIYAAIPPGANQSVVLTVSTGTFQVGLPYTLDVGGAVLTAGPPAGFAAGPRGYAAVAAYASGLSGAFSLSAAVYGAQGSCEPSPATVQAGGEPVVVGCRFDAQGVGRVVLSLSVTDPAGGTHTASWEVLLASIQVASISSAIAAAYTEAINVVLRAIAVLLVVMVGALFLQTVSGAARAFPEDAVRSVLFGLVLLVAVMAVLIPGVFYVASQLLSQVEPFRDLTCLRAQGGGLQGYIASMASCYDELFSKIQEDYANYLVRSVGEVASAARNLVIVAAAMLAVSTALSFIPVLGGLSQVPGAVGTALLSLGTTYIGFIVATAPAIAVASAAVAIAQVFIVAAAVIVIIALVLGAALISIPAPQTQLMGESLFSGALLFILVFPLLGPIALGVYSYTVGQAISAVQAGLQPVSFLGAVIPVTAIATISVFLAALGVVFAMIFGVLGFALTRTGIAAGVGEALSSLVWRI